MGVIDPAMIHALGVRIVDHDHLADRPAEHAAVQTSTIAAIVDGNYDGDVTIGELLEAGDLGIGTLDGLDGEVIIVDGEAWQAAYDGSVRRIASHQRTPFAVVTKFSTDDLVEIDEPIGWDALLALLEEHAPQDSGCDAIRIDGHFSRVHARSVPKQSKPYPPLVEVTAGQVEWEFEGVEGTVVGFRFPEAVSGVEVVGHHLHFISADRTRGGHVLECDVEKATVRIEELDEMRIELPPGVPLTESEDVAREAALRRAEQPSGEPPASSRLDS